MHITSQIVPNMNSFNLLMIIKNVIVAVQPTGLKVISTVCDQAPSNVAAINRLVQETQQSDSETRKNINTFEIGGFEIIPIFDVPYLLKGLRNNLITKNLHFIYESKQKIASWKHIVQFYQMDKELQSMEGDRLIFLKSLSTDSHVYPVKMKKMKVSLAATVFSQRVGSIMKRMAIMTKKSNFIGEFFSSEFIDFLMTTTF